MKGPLIGFLIFLTIVLGVLYVDQRIRDGNRLGASPTFGRYRCTKDCSGHVAGYKWAEQRKVSTAFGCPHGNSKSFYEGCLTYVHDANGIPTWVRFAVILSAGMILIYFNSRRSKAAWSGPRAESISHDVGRSTRR